MMSKIFLFFLIPQIPRNPLTKSKIVLLKISAKSESIGFPYPKPIDKVRRRITNKTKSTIVRP